MVSRNIEFKVGLLVLVGGAIVVLAFWLAKGYRYGQEFDTISVVFPEVGALAPGDPVSVSGVSKGKVKDIALYEGDVLVRLDLARDVILREDASFAVMNIGLMGERFVAVKTGHAEEKLDVSRPARGGFDPGIPEVMGMMGDVIGKLNNLVSLLEKTVISPTTLDRFTETITGLHKIVSRLEKAADKNLPGFSRAIKNFAELSADLKSGLSENRPMIDSAVQNFEIAARRLNNLTVDLELASARLKSFATDLDESEGSMRLLMEDRRLYDDLRSTALNLDSLVQDIRENPKKYINFTVEIF